MTMHAPVIPTRQRGAARVALDLWRARGSFRGFTEFALIGAVVLAFLPGAQLNLGAFGGAKPNATAPAGPVKPSELAPKTLDLPLAPRISDVAFTGPYFDDVKEPTRTRLVNALAAYQARNLAQAGEALAKLPDHPKVLLLRGLNALAIGRRESLYSGVGLLARAIEQGEPRAMAVLGIIKVAGTPGLDRDQAGGRALLERAAAAGDAAAPRVMAEGFLTGWMGAVDPPRARQYFELASDRGDTKATFRLAEMLSVGYGVPKDDAAAERLFAKAAESGHAEALAMLGARQLARFGSGLTDNVDDALRWLNLAAAQNEPHAMYHLGMFHVEYGRRIGRLDLPRGFELFRRCAEATLDRDCLFSYATALDLGLGATRDPVRAYAMYVLAAAGGPSKAQARRDALAKTLSAEEVTRANLIATQIMQNAKTRR